VTACVIFSIKVEKIKNKVFSKLIILIKAKNLVAFRSGIISDIQMVNGQWSIINELQ